MDNSITDALSGPTITGLTAFVLLLIARIPTVNRRMSRFLDPLVRWWTRGALTDQVLDRERAILFRRTQDVDIMEAYLDEVARYMVDARAVAAEHGFRLPKLKTFRQFKADWIKRNPSYANEWGSRRRIEQIEEEVTDDDQA